MNREITHAAEKSSLYFSVWWDNWRAKHTEQPADPQLSPPCAARWHEIAFSCFAFPIAGSLESHAQVLQRPVGHIPLGITAIPSRREGREMQAKRDGQAARREELGGKEPCCGDQDEHRPGAGSCATGQGERKQSYTVITLYRIRQQDI